MGKKAFTYLCIPADDDLAVKNCVQEFEASDEVGCLTTTLSKHFALVSMTESSRGSMRQMLHEEAEKKGIAADDGALDQLSRVQMVQVLPLLLATRENDYNSVSVYCDDSAVAKAQTLNKRATKLSVACGKPMRLMGDVFVARAQDDNHDVYHRMDLRVEDFTPQAEWVLNARAANTAVTTRTGVSKAPLLTKARLDTYAAELEQWVVTKLNVWDTDEDARAKKLQKYESRRGYEEWLRGKVKEQLAGKAKELSLSIKMKRASKGKGC